MSGIKTPSPPQLYQFCDLSQLKFENTAELEPLDETIGQKRALEAIEFGIGIGHAGYNLWLMGASGLGKHQAIRQALEKHRGQAPTPSDWCYIGNFAETHRPLALKLPPGKGRALRKDMHQLVEDLLDAIPAAFRSNEYRQRAETINQDFKRREEKAAESLGKKAKDQDIALIQTPSGYTLAPVRDGRMLKDGDVEQLPEEEQESLAEIMEQLRAELRQTMSEVSIWQRERRKRFKALDRESVSETVTRLVAELEESYRNLPDVLNYIDAVKQDVVDNLEQFRQDDGSNDKLPVPDDIQFNRYKINLLVDNAETSGAPVIYEDNPTYLNLVGHIEHISRLGTLMTDFTLIKPGALHRANGGYLILDAVKLLTNVFAWDTLKRMLKAREIRIESLERLLSLSATTSLEPQPIAVDLKVALIGDRLLYDLLKAYDPEFCHLFKVAADFAEDMSRDDGNEQLYARFIATLQQRGKLLPLERGAVELIIEQAARQAADGHKMTLQVSSLLDLLQESDYWAGKDQSPLTGRNHVQAAIDAKKHRLDQLHEQLQEEVLRGTLKIDTRGTQLGRVNGLTLIYAGDDYNFGMPTRISATARLGSGEVVDIQREVDQAGPNHSKGVLILTAYLARRYAKYQPLCLSASLVFEQTYGMVEGDSASAAELCALLSAIGDVPLKQNLAITGSVNQHGEIQAIGGINEKIEGFFDICSARGLTREHGVIMPEANLPHLMLRRDLIDAVATGAFHIYPVGHVDQAMELFTAQPAGVPNAEGVYPLDSINGQIQLRLAEWFELRQQLGGERGREQD